MNTVKCPTCKAQVAFGSPDFPFCSDRCRQIDLGNWATEQYRFSSPIIPTTGEEGAPLPPPDSDLED
ncbi:MAG: DNA gyrase inhibitor YacG [Acidobacteria bacterium]|nr:DNA gyrase inhibitor YacG [Acidobacteriota bacterium]